MVSIETKTKWKVLPGCNGHFDISVSPFNIIHTEKCQTYSRKGNRPPPFKPVIYILADIPTSTFSGEILPLHSQCISSLMSAHLKDLHTGATFELQPKVNSRRVWLNILFMQWGISLLVSAPARSGLHLWWNTASLTSLVVCEDFQEPAY